MQGDELQHIVDTLAERLQRSVSVDDPSMRLLAASRHFGDEDPARVRSVLDRYAGAEETRFVLAHGIASWTEPGRVPEHPPALSARLCVPVRCHSLLLGYLWLIDPDETVTRDETALAVETADAAGLLLYRRVLLHEREQARASSLLRALVSPDATARASAAEEIRDDELLAADGHVLVLTAEVFDVADPAAREQAAVALGTAVEAAARTVPARTMLAYAHGSRALLLLASGTPPAARTVDEVVATIQQRFARLVGDQPLVVGVGSVRRGLEQVAESYRHAAVAARAARLLPETGPVAHWDRLGLYALLLQLPRERVAAEDWAPALTALHDHDPRGTLTETVETYLDNAGDVRRTARQLRVHRTTLYHRLQRAERATGIDLADGTARLTLHLALKLARLADAWRLRPDT